MTLTGRGDVPIGEREALTGARLRVLAVLRRSGESLTLASLSEMTGSHVNTLREHLAALVSTGLVESVIVHSAEARRGRPPLAYRALGVAPRQVDATSVLDALAREVAARVDSDEIALRAGERWGVTLNGDDGEPDLMVRLAELGFSPKRVEEGIVLRSCPVGSSATAVPEVVCRMHLGAIRQLGAGADVAELAHGGHAEGCLLRIGPR